MLQAGALIAPASERVDLCARANVDTSKMEAYVRTAVRPSMA
jgi:hypothetical protein